MSAIDVEELVQINLITVATFDIAGNNQPRSLA